MSNAVLISRQAWTPPERRCAGYAGPFVMDVPRVLFPAHLCLGAMVKYSSERFLCGSSLHIRKLWGSENIRFQVVPNFAKQHTYRCFS